MGHVLREDENKLVRRRWTSKMMEADHEKATENVDQCSGRGHALERVREVKMLMMEENGEGCQGLLG